MTDRDDEPDSENTRRQKRRALPNNFEQAGRQAQIEILSDFEAADLPAFCRASKTFAAQFCGSGDPDEVGLLDRDIVYEHWQVWLARDYGISHDPNLCAAFAPLERELVADSMQRHVDLNARGMTNWKRLKALARLYRRLLQSVSQTPIRNRQFRQYWGCRDGIAVVSSYYQWRQPQLWLVSIVDVLMQNDVDPRQTPIRHILLMQQRPLFEVRSVKMSGSHTGLYLVREARTQVPNEDDDDDDNNGEEDGDNAKYQYDQSTLIFVHERRVIGARLRVALAFDDTVQGELWIDPLMPHLAFIQVWERNAVDATNSMQDSLVTYVLDGTDEPLRVARKPAAGDSGGLWMGAAGSPRLIGKLRAIRILTGDELAQRNANVDVYTERFHIATTDSAYTYENADGAWFFTSHAIFPASFYTNVYDRIFVVPVVKAATAVQAQRFRMRIVIARIFSSRNDSIARQLSGVPLQIAEVQFDNDSLTAPPARAIHFNDLLVPRVSFEWTLSEPMLFGRKWVILLLEHIDVSDEDSRSIDEPPSRPVSVAAFDFERGVLKQTLNSDRPEATTEILADKILAALVPRLSVYNNSLVGLNAARFSRSFGVSRKWLSDSIRAPAQIENAKS